jgi:hypothetical protein
MCLLIIAVNVKRTSLTNAINCHYGHDRVNWSLLQFAEIKQWREKRIRGSRLDGGDAGSELVMTKEQRCAS